MASEITAADLPGDEYWIERVTHVVGVPVVEMHHGDVPGVREERIVGKLRGSWPMIGLVRRQPSLGGVETITEVSLRIGVDGTMRREIGGDLDEDARVAVDKRGATVVEFAPGLFEVSCESHATHLKSDDRGMLERRATTHNAKWHPGL